MVAIPPSETTVGSWSLDDGFRRVAPAPTAGEIGTLRALLTRAASGQPRVVQDGLAALGSWENAGAGATSGLFPAGALGRSPAGRRAVQRVLRLLGTRPALARSLPSTPRGTPVRVRGQVKRSRWKVVSHIWRKSETSGHTVRLLTEEGHDFFLVGLDDAPGPPLEEILVLAAGGWLVGGAGTSIVAGDTVEVLGFVDRILEPASRAGSSKPRGEPIALVLRAGDDLPLVVSKISDPAGNDRGVTLR